MKDRPNGIRRRLVAGLAGSMTVAAFGGCTNLLFTAAYLWKGNDAPAECAKLKEKRVAVVCRPLVTLQYNNARVDHDLARELSALLRKNVPKIKVVDHRKVAEWMDEQRWDEFIEVGKALKADVVVGIDLEQFDLRQSQTLFQGRGTVQIKVVDCHTGKTVFLKRPPQVVYPPNRGVATSDMQEVEFRASFVHVLAAQIGQYFYDHDRYDNFAMDSKTIE